MSTQAAWDDHDFTEFALLERCGDGLHHFNVRDPIREVATGRNGVVIRRTTLTATVRWEDGTEETIDQLDSHYMSMSFITY